MSVGPKIGKEPDIIDLTGTGALVTLNWVPIRDTHQLEAGNSRDYNKGWILEATVDWTREALVPMSFSDDLADLYSLTCDDTIFFWPFPDKYPGSFYKVKLVGKWDLNPPRGLTGMGLAGRMMLVGKEVYDEKPKFLT